MRPANYPKGSPGRGHTVVVQDGRRLGVINLSGQVFLDAVRSPFSEADSLLAELRDRTDSMLIDMHAEATSEGGHGLARTAAPRPASAPHPRPTADARVLPGGTAYVTDVGMTGRGRRDRRQARAGPRALPDAHPGAIRDVRRGSMAERGAGGSRRRRPRDRNSATARACADSSGCSRRPLPQAPDRLPRRLGALPGRSPAGLPGGRTSRRPREPAVSARRGSAAERRRVPRPAVERVRARGGRGRWPPLSRSARTVRRHEATSRNGTNQTM